MTRTTLWREDALDLSLCWYAPRSRMAPHAHETHQLSWLLAGELREQDGRRERDMTGPSIGVKRAGFRHANAYGPHGALILSLNLRPDGEAAAATRELDDWRWSPCDGGTAGARALARTVERGGTAARDAAWDLLAIAAGPSPTVRPDRVRVAPAWLRRVRERLGCPEETSDISALARDEGVHRVYLSRRFREVFGVSPSLYRRGCRLARAVAGLVEGDAAAGVAQDAGFADQAHLGRVARRELGLTPGQLGGLLAP